MSRPARTSGCTVALAAAWLAATAAASSLSISADVSPHSSFRAASPADVTFEYTSSAPFEADDAVSVILDGSALQGTSTSLLGTDLDVDGTAVPVSCAAQDATEYRCTRDGTGADYATGSVITFTARITPTAAGDGTLALSLLDGPTFTERERSASASVGVDYRRVATVTNYFVVGSSRFATMDDTALDTVTQGCQNETYAVPSGWSLANASEDARVAVLARTWGTACIVMSDGTSYNTRSATSCGDGQLTTSDNGREQGHRATECGGGRRVLVTQPMQSGDVDSTVAVEISNSFAYAGFEFATVDNAQPFTTDTSGCQSGPIQLPSGGWEVAADDSDTLAALLGPRTQFETNCLVISSGRSIFASDTSSTCLSNQLRSVGDFVFMVDCSQRVLIRRNATAGAEPLFTVENDLNVTQATLVLGQYFIALDGTGAEVTTSGCASPPKKLPSGWYLADFAMPATQAAFADYAFGTTCLVLADGQSYDVNTKQQCGSDQLIEFEGAYTVRECNRRVLAYSPGPRLAYCQSWGDPHFTTFDEQFTKFDFFGVGEYWLMRTIGNVFNVQGRQFKTGKASSNSAAAVSLGGTVVNVFTASELEEPRLTVDGVEVDQAAALPLQVGDITISRQGALRVDSQPESDADMTYEIQHTITADRVRVVVQASPYLVQYLHIYIRASGGSYYNTAGLCGNWNDDRGDDYELPDGSVLNATEPTPAQVHDWAMQWRVTSLANSLFHHNGTTPDDFYDPNWDPVYDPTDLADISFITAAEEQCRGLSLELSYFRACVMDMVQVNDTSLVRAALRAQSENGDLTGINFTTAEDPSAPATATGFTSLVFETQRTTYGDEICLEFPARLPAGLVNDAVLAVHVPQGLAVTSTSLLPPGEDVLQALTAYEGGDPLHADNVTLKVFTDQAACCSAGVRDSAGAAVRATPLSAVTAAFVDMYVQPDGSGGTARDVGVRACMRVLPDSGPEGAGGSYVITASLNFTSASGVAKSTDDAVTNVTLAEPRPQGNATWTWEQPVEAGSQLTVHFTVTNAEEEEEEAALRNVTLVQTPPHGTDYAGGGEVDVTWSGGDAPTSTGSVVVRLVGGRLHVDVGDLDPGRSASLALTFVVNGALPVGEPITLSGTSQVVHNVVPLPSGSDLLDDAALRYTANTTRTGDSALAMELGPRIRGAPTLAVRNSSLRGSSGNSMLPSEGFDFRAVFELTEGAFGDVVLGLLLPASLEFRSCALDFEAHGAHVVSIGDGDSVQGLAARIADAGNYDTAAVSDVAAAIGVDLLHIGGSAAATLGHGNGVRVALRLGDLRNTVDGVTDARDQLALRCRLRHRRAEWLAPAPVVSVVRVNASHAGVQAVEAAAANVTVFGGGPQPNVTAVWSPTDGVPPGHTTTLSLVLTNPATPGGGVYPIFNATVLVVTPEGLRPGSTARANITLRDPSGDEVEGGSVAVAIIGGGSGVRVVFPTLQPGTVATVHLAFTVRVDVSYGGAVVSLGRAVSLTYLDALGEAGRAALEVNATNLGAGALVTPALGQWTASLALYATGLADTTGQELAVGESLTLRATLPLHRGRWPSLNATLAVPAGLRVLGASLVTVGASVTSHQRFEQSGTEAAPLDAESFDLGPAHVTAVANVTDTAGAGASGGPSRGEVAHVSLGDIVVWSDSGAAGTVVVQWRAVVVDAAFVTDGLALDAAPGVAFLALTGPAGAATAEATAAWGGAARLGTVHTPTLVLALQWSSVSGGSLRPGDGVNVTATVGHALGGDTSSAPLQLLLAQETDTAVSRAPAYNVTLRVPLPPYTALATGNVASDVAVAFAGGAVNAVTFAAAGDVTDPLRSPQAGEVRVTLHVMLPLPSLAPSVRVALVTEDGGPLQADVTPGEAQAAYRTAPAPGGDGGRRLLANATALAGLSPTPLLLVNAPLFVRVEEVSSSLAHTAAGTAAVGERVTWELTLEARAGRFNDTVAFLALPPGVSVEEAAVVRHGADVTVTDSAPGESVNLTERAVEIVSWGSPLLPALGADLIPPDATAGDTRSGSVRVVRVALGNLLSTGSGGPPSEVVLRVTGALEDDPAVTRGATLAVGGGVNATAQDDTVEQPVSLRLQADPYRAEVAAPLLLAGVRYLAREGGSAGPLWAATFEVNASAAAAPAFDANVTVTLAAELMLDLAVRDSLPAPLCPFPCAVEPAQMTSGLRVITVRGDPGGGDPQLPPGSGVRITLEVALVDPGAADDPVASSLLDTRVSVDGRAYSGPRSQIPASRRRLYRDEATERLPFSVAPVLSAPWVHASGWNRTSTSLADPGREEASVGEWFVLRCNATISAAAEYSSAVLHALPPSILGTSGSTVAATLLWHRVVRAGGSLQSSAAQEAGEGAFLEARFSGAGQAFVGSAISFPLGTVTAAEALGPGLAADNLTFTVEVGLVVSHTDAPPAVDAAPVLAFPFRLATLDELGTAHAPTANATVEIVRPNATLAASVTVQSDSAPPDPLFTGVSATVDAGAVFLVWVNVTQATAVAGPAFAPRLRIAPPPGENASLELLNATAGDGTPLAAQRGTESALVDAAAVEVVLAAGALRPAGAGDGGSIASAAEPWTVFLRLRVADSVTPAAALRLDSTLRYATAPSVEPAVLASASGNEAGEAKVALAEAALAVRSEASVRVAPTMAPFVSFTAVNSSANITSAPALVYGEVVAYRVRVAFAEGVTPDASVLVVLPAATVVGVGTVSTRHVPLMRGGAVAVERCGSGYAAATCARAGEPPAHAAAASATAAVVSPGATHWAGAAAEADSSAALAAALPGSPLPLPLPGTLPSAAYNTSALLLRFGDVVNAPTNAVSLEEDAVDILVWAAVLQQPRAWELQLSSQLAAPIPSPQAVLLWRPGVVPAPVAAAARETVDGASALPDPLPSPLWDGTAATEPDWALQELRNASAARIVRPLLVTSVRDESDVPLLVDGRVRLLVNVSHAATSSSAAFDVAATVVLPPHVTVRVLETGVIASPPEAGAATVSVSDPRPGSGVTSVTLRVDRIDLSRHLAAVIEGDANDLHVPGADVPAGVCEAFAAVPRGDGAVEPGSPAAAALPAPSEGPPAGNATRCTVAAAGLSTWLAPPATVLSRAEEAETCVAVVTRRCEVASPFDAGGSSPRSDNGTASRRMQEELNAPGSTKMILAAWLNGTTVPGSVRDSVVVGEVYKLRLRTRLLEGTLPDTRLRLVLPRGAEALAATVVSVGSQLRRANGTRGGEPFPHLSTLRATLRRRERYPTVGNGYIDAAPGWPSPGANWSAPSRPVAAAGILGDEGACVESARTHPALAVEACPACTRDTVTWGLGHVLNPGDGARGADEEVVVEALVLVHSVEAVEAGAELAHSADVRFRVAGNDAALTTEAPSVIVREPALALTWSARAPAGLPALGREDGGALLQVVVNITHTPASSAVAYDLLLQHLTTAFVNASARAVATAAGRNASEPFARLLPGTLVVTRIAGGAALGTLRGSGQPRGGESTHRTQPGDAEWGPLPTVRHPLYAAAGGDSLALWPGTAPLASRTPWVAEGVDDLAVPELVPGDALVVNATLVTTAETAAAVLASAQSRPAGGTEFSLRVPLRLSWSSSPWVEGQGNPGRIGSVPDVKRLYWARLPAPTPWKWPWWAITLLCVGTLWALRLLHALGFLLLANHNFSLAAQRKKPAPQAAAEAAPSPPTPFSSPTPSQTSGPHTPPEPGKGTFIELAPGPNCNTAPNAFAPQPEVPVASDPAEPEPEDVPSSPSPSASATQLSDGAGPAGVDDASAMQPGPYPEHRPEEEGAPSPEPESEGEGAAVEVATPSVVRPEANAAKPSPPPLKPETDVPRARSKHPKMQRIPGDEVQNRLAAIMNRDGAAYDFAFVRIGPGKYWWGRRRVIVKIVNDQIVVLLGGGYMTLKKFLRLYGTASDAGQEAVAAFHGAARASAAGKSGPGYGVGDQNYKKEAEGGIEAQGHISVSQDVVNGQVVGETKNTMARRYRGDQTRTEGKYDGSANALTGWRSPEHVTSGDQLDALLDGQLPDRASGAAK